MKTLVVAFTFVSLVATSAWAKTESPIPTRTGVLPLFLKADRLAARPAPRFALILGVAF